MYTPHLIQFAALPLCEQRDLWLFWMERTRWCFQCQDWSGGLSFAGCAFELASISQQEHGGSGMAVELTLAAILVARVADARGETDLAQETIDHAREYLWPQTAISAETVPKEVVNCFRVLRDPEQHPAFFFDYFNWPEWWLEQSESHTPAAPLIREKHYYGRPSQ